jgi:hypothetical protein
MVNTPNSYSGGPGFKPRPGEGLFWGVSCVFSVTLSKGRYNTSKAGYDRFITTPFRFTIHLSSLHSTLYSLSHWKSVIEKLQTNQISFTLQFSNYFASQVQVLRVSNSVLSARLFRINKHSSSALVTPCIGQSHKLPTCHCATNSGFHNTILRPTDLCTLSHVAACHCTRSIHCMAVTSLPSTDCQTDSTDWLAQTDRLFIIPSLLLDYSRQIGF